MTPRKRLTVMFGLMTAVASQPVLAVMAANTGESAAAGPTTVAVLQPGLSSGFGFRAGVPIQRLESEMSFVVMTGANRLTSDAITFDNEKPPW